MNAILPTRRRINVHEYHRMGEAGILHEDDRVELIEGDLIQMSPIGTDHSGTVNSFTYALVMACAGKAVVSVQNPVRLDDESEPRPDFAILRFRPDMYRSKMPGPDDVLLLIEVADSSIKYDKSIKLPLYARSRIVEVWIIDLQRKKLDAYCGAADGSYGKPTPYKAGDHITLALAPEISLIIP